MIPISLRLKPPTNITINSVNRRHNVVERSGSINIRAAGTAINAASFIRHLKVFSSS